MYVRRYNNVRGCFEANQSNFSFNQKYMYRRYTGTYFTILLSIIPLLHSRTAFLLVGFVGFEGRVHVPKTSCKSTNKRTML